MTTMLSKTNPIAGGLYQVKTKNGEVILKGDSCNLVRNGKAYFSQGLVLDTKDHVFLALKGW